MKGNITSLETYKSIYNKSIQDPEGFWSEIAENYNWQKKWDRTLEWDFSKADARWFINGKVNITENCIDRHLTENSENIAIIWEPNEPNEKAKNFTYQELHDEVCKMANVLKNLGIKKGDRICIYMPMVPELAFAVLACARIGAIHSVVFGGFSSNAISDRINDSQCSLVITTDGMFRGNKKIPVKAVIDEALLNCPSIKNTIVVRRTFENVQMTPNRDFFL